MNYHPRGYQSMTSFQDCQAPYMFGGGLGPRGMFAAAPQSHHNPRGMYGGGPRGMSQSSTNFRNRDKAQSIRDCMYWPQTLSPDMATGSNYANAAYQGDHTGMMYGGEPQMNYVQVQATPMNQEYGGGNQQMNVGGNQQMNAGGTQQMNVGQVEMQGQASNNGYSGGQASNNGYSGGQQVQMSFDNSGDAASGNNSYAGGLTMNVGQAQVSNNNGYAGQMSYNNGGQAPVYASGQQMTYNAGRTMGQTPKSGGQQMSYNNNAGRGGQAANNQQMNGGSRPGTQTANNSYPGGKQVSYTNLGPARQASRQGTATSQNYDQPKAFIMSPSQGGQGEMTQMPIPFQMGPSGSQMSPMKPMEPVTVNVQAPAGAGANGQPISFTLSPDTLYGGKR